MPEFVYDFRVLVQDVDLELGHYPVLSNLKRLSCTQHQNVPMLTPTGSCVNMEGLVFFIETVVRPARIQYIR